MPQPPGPGSFVADYEITEELASGGFGAVYRAVHRTLGQKVALKVLHPSLTGSREAVLRFEREARAVTLIHHPNVVQIHDFGETPDGVHYLAMELLDGVDLQARLKSVGRLLASEALAILEPICDALTAAHAQGIVHRDLKASNVFLARQGAGERVVLLDFGIAKLLGDEAVNLTTSRNMIGTPIAMAPEQFAGRPVDARTDVYALGTLAFHMLTGEPPFHNETATRMGYMHLHKPRPAPSTRAAVAPALDEVAMRAMQVRPKDRFPSVAEFLAAFRDAVRSQRPVRRDVAADADGSDAVACFVDLRASAGAMENPDDALLDAIESLLDAAEQHFGAAGFATALETTNGALFVRAIADQSPAIARRDAANAARAFVDELARRPDGDARLHANVALHVARAVVTDGTVSGGPILRVAEWAPRSDVPGLVATPAALDGLDVVTQELAGETVRQLLGAPSAIHC